MGWGVVSVGSAEFGPTAPSQKLGMLMYVWNPRAGDMETGELLGFARQPVKVKMERTRFSETLSQVNMVEK